MTREVYLDEVPLISERSDSPRKDVETGDKQPWHLRRHWESLLDLEELQDPALVAVGKRRGRKLSGSLDLPKFKDPELLENGGRFARKLTVLQVTIRLPLDLDPLNLIALVYGFLPSIIPVVFLIMGFWSRLCEFGFIVYLALLVVNEVGLKHCIDAPSPELSANRRADGTMVPGMPCGHVLTSTTLMMWMLLEIGWQAPKHVPGQHTLDITSWIFDMTLTDWMWLLTVIILMGPVPWARWYNHDHSAEQVAVAWILSIPTSICALWIHGTYLKDISTPW